MDEITGIKKLTSSDKYRAVDDLIEESRASGTYYSLLILSSVIISAGILLANSAILIGGMLVTPLLNPILLIALGVATSNVKIIKRTGKLILKSSLFIIAISFIAGLLFSIPENGDFYRSSIFDNSLRSAFLYFLVAFASGIAATFAWVRKEVTNILPGISIAVSLVPPVAMTGIWLATFDLDLFRFFLFVFLFNLIGIIMGAMIVFSMLGFYKTGIHLNQKIKEEIKAEAKQEAKKEAEKKEKLIEEAKITEEKIEEGKNNYA